jgi:ankyrin repeat protein
MNPKTIIRVTACLGPLLALVTASASADERLVRAVRERKPQEVNALLKQHVNVNSSEADGATALHWAAHWDDLHVATELIAAGARVDTRNDYGVAPIQLAATNGSVRMLELLLKAGADANTALPSGETVLMTAARSGNPDAMTLLLAHGADPNAKQTSKGQTALMWAVAEGHIGAARVLLDRGADIGARTAAGFTPLMFAAREPRLEVVQLLVDHGGGINDSASDGSTPLLVATVRGHVDIANYLLDKGAKPDGDLAKAGYAPLHWAAGKFEGVITFDYPEAPGEWSALAGIPSRQGKIELIKSLLAHGATVNAAITKGPPRYGYHLFGLGRGDLITGATPFYLATLVADLEVMRLLLTSGADAGVRISNGSTALMVAAGLGHQDQESRVPQEAYLEATKLMLELRPDDVRVTNKDGFTAMHGAAWAGFETVIQLLADHGADINAKNTRDETPLDITEGYHFSFFFERPAAAAVLHKLGAVGGVERGGLLAGQTKKELEEQEKSKAGGRPAPRKDETPSGK